MLAITQRITRVVLETDEGQLCVSEDENNSNILILSVDHSFFRFHRRDIGTVVDALTLMADG